MLQLLLLAILLMLALYGVHGLLQKRLTKPDTRSLALWAGAGALLFLVATGRLGWLAALVGALLATLTRLLPLLVQLAPFIMGERGQQRSTGRSGAGEQTRRPPPGGRMTRDEALEVLGLEPGANRKQIAEAHRRLMQKIHPDRGGSAYLAAQLNQARDVLLG